MGGNWLWLTRSTCALVKLQGLINHGFDEDGLELLTWPEVQLKLSVKVHNIGIRVGNVGTDLPQEILVRHSFVEEFHRGLQFLHKYLVLDLQTGQEHDHLPIEVGHTERRAPNDPQIVLAAFELTHRRSHLDQAFHALPIVVLE